MPKRIRTAGLAPGTVVYTGNRKTEKVWIHHLYYNDREIHDQSFDNHSKIVFEKAENQIDWYDIRGIDDIALIESIGKAFDIHSLVLEDIADVNQRPKFEEYPNGMFVIFRALNYDKKSGNVETEQVSIFFRPGLLISFQETESDLFASVRKRALENTSKLRKKTTDYLAYALVDAITDHYYYILDEIQDIIQDIEESFVAGVNRNIRNDIHRTKKELLEARRAIHPLREGVNRIMILESDFISENTKIFIRDLHDHVINILDTIDIYRDLLNGLQDLYVSEISLKSNQVMQILTLVATIFIPLSFIAAVYGMNFENMPELKWKYGYYAIWTVMIGLGFSAVYYFKRKKWF